MSNVITKPCVLCEKSAKDCRCNFKTPRKGKWARKSELWTTSPRNLAEIMQQIKEQVSIQNAGAREFIFKLSIIEIKSALPPAATNCGDSTATDAARNNKGHVRVMGGKG